jgi:Protein of unknown function (DUF2919)
MAKVDDYLLQVNRYGVLSIPLGLWLAMAFLARHWLLVVIVLVSARRSKESVMLLGGDFSWWVLLLEAPVLAVVAAAIARRPEGGALARACWRHGRGILSVTALLNIGLAGWYLWNSSYWNPWPELFVASCALLDLAIIYAMATNDPVKQVFAEFPNRVTPPTPSGSAP